MMKPETFNDSVKLRDHSVAELQAANLQLKEAQMKLRLQHAVGQVEKTHQIREMRRQRARLLTVLSEKLAAHDLGAHAHAETAPATAPAGAKAAPARKAAKGAKLAKKAGHKAAPHKAKAKAVKAARAKPAKAAKKPAGKKKAAKKK